MSLSIGQNEVDVVSLNRRRAWIFGFLGPVIPAAVGPTLIGNLLPIPYNTACGIALLFVLITCIWTDCNWHKIPNWLTYPGFFWALVLNIVGSSLAIGSSTLETPDRWQFVGPPQLGAVGIERSLLGAAVCFAGMFLASGRLRSAGGDVKLGIVLGSYLGPYNGLLALCFGYVVAGSVSLVLCIAHYGALRLLKFSFAWVGSRVAPQLVDRPYFGDARFLYRPIPLGAYFAIGTLISLLPIPGLQMP